MPIYSLNMLWVVVNLLVLSPVIKFLFFFSCFRHQFLMSLLPPLAILVNFRHLKKLAIFRCVSDYSDMMEMEINERTKLIQFWWFSHSLRDQNGHSVRVKILFIMTVLMYHLSVSSLFADFANVFAYCVVFWFDFSHFEHVK